MGCILEVLSVEGLAFGFDWLGVLVIKSYISDALAGW
jgi:hypothetical protein